MAQFVLISQREMTWTPPRKSTYFFDKWASLQEPSLASQQIDIVFIDAADKELHKFLRWIKSSPTMKWTPVVLVGDRIPEEIKQDAIKLGADDFLELGYENGDLLLEKWAKKGSEIVDAIFRDALTGVYNRGYFNHQIRLYFDQSQKSGDPISIGFIDADRFKSINDTYGHHIGDVVLQKLAETISNRIRSSDLVFRYGGEEFVILFPGTTIEVANGVMERILKELRSQPVVEVNEKPLYVTFSGGIAEWNRSEALDRWVENADQAAYQAKGKGRNCIVLHQPTHSEMEQRNHQVIIYSGNEKTYIDQILTAAESAGLAPVEVSDDLALVQALRSSQHRSLMFFEIASISRLKELTQLISQYETKPVLVKAALTTELLLAGLALGLEDILIDPAVEDIEIMMLRFLDKERH